MRVAPHNFESYINEQKRKVAQNLRMRYELRAIQKSINIHQGQFSWMSANSGSVLAKLALKEESAKHFDKFLPKSKNQAYRAVEENQPTTPSEITCFNAGSTMNLKD